MSKTGTPEEVAQRAGSAVASILEERGLNNEWLANKLAIEPATLADYLSIRIPAHAAFEIADALDITIRDVLPVHS